MKNEVRPIDANALNLKIREYMSDYKGSPTRLAVCRAVLSMLGDDGQTPTLTDHFRDPAKRAQQDTAWISVKDWLPENEKDVLIAYTRKGPRVEVYSCVGMAFHTDGKTNTDDSAFSWQTEYIDMDYDEKSDAYIIPEGWWETVDFGEEFSAVDMVVTHWMPLPEPPEED